MNVSTGRLNEAIERLLPFLVVVAFSTCGYIWFVQPRLSPYLRTRTEVRALGDRVRTLQQSISRARSLSPVDTLASLREFEKQMSREDGVPDVAAALAKAVLDSAPPDELRGFMIETGDRVQQTADPGSRSAFGSATGPRGDASDPRVRLFPYAVSFTPMRITFESTFQAAGIFLWKLRDLPTVVEVRSVRMTRGLPLMKMDVLVRVFQRGDAIGAGEGVPSGEPGPPPPGSTAPRVAPSSTGAEG